MLIARLGGRDLACPYLVVRDIVGCGLIGRSGELTDARIGDAKGQRQTGTGADGKLPGFRYFRRGGKREVNGLIMLGFIRSHGDNADIDGR